MSRGTEHLRPGASITGSKLKRIIDESNLAPVSGPGISIGGAHVGETTISADQPYTPAAKSEFQPMRIESSELETANRWRYLATPTMLDDGGSWVPQPGALQVVLWNLAELRNGTNGVQGNGINVDNLPQGFGLVPVPDGEIVEARAYTSVGNNVWWFREPNGVDGECSP